MRADFERFFRRSAHFGIEVNQIEDSQEEEEGSENEWIVLELHGIELLRVSSQQLKPLTVNGHTADASRQAPP